VSFYFLVLVSFRFSILSSSLAKKISAMPIIIGTRAGIIAPVFIKIAIPKIIPATPKRMFSIAILSIVGLD